MQLASEISQDGIFDFITAEIADTRALNMFQNKIHLKAITCANTAYKEIDCLLLCCNLLA